jgi:hypothetical protein
VNKRLLWLCLFCIATFVIAFCYFLRWRSVVVYGDDLIIYKDYSGNKNLLDNIKLLSSFGKFRPVQSLLLNLVLRVLGKKIFAYYVLNVTVQVINGLLLTLLADCFLKNLKLSCLFGIAYSISRFSIFNITQLFNGGILEGIALTFYLLSLYYILKALTDGNLRNKVHPFLLGIFFANLSMYTHERYIMMLVFIIVTALFFTCKILSSKQKLLIATVSILSIAANILIKKTILGMPFFVGTGGTHIAFSFSTAISFFIDGILSIIQINSGDENLIGIKHSSLSFSYQILLVIFVCSITFLFVKFIFANTKKNSSNDRGGLHLFLLLCLLIFLLLVPAVVTIRIEQRWLQASNAGFLLLIVLSFSAMDTKIARKNLLAGLLIFLFLFIDYTYLRKGAPGTYMMNSERNVCMLKSSLDHNIIWRETDSLFIIRKVSTIYYDQDIQWTLADGYFFSYYQGKNKILKFIDSVQIPSTLSSCHANTQIISLADSVVTIHKS